MVLGLDVEAALLAAAAASSGSALFTAWRGRQTVNDFKALLVEMRARDLEKIKAAVTAPAGLPPLGTGRPVRREPPTPRPYVRGRPVRQVAPPAPTLPPPPPPEAEPAYGPEPPPLQPEPPRPAAPVGRRVIQEEEVTRRRRIEESGVEEPPREPAPPREVVDLPPEPAAGAREAAAGPARVILVEPPPPREVRGRRESRPEPPPPPQPRRQAPLPARAAPPPPPVPLPSQPSLKAGLLASRRGLSDTLGEQLKRGIISRKTYDYLVERAVQTAPGGEKNKVAVLLRALETQRKTGAISEATYQRSRNQLLKQMGQ